MPEPKRRLGAYPHQLSGGQQQRVMIAMALACEPKLLIADEPTTALDVTIQRQILELLAGLKERHRMSMLFISHDLGVVGEIADQVVVMRHGTVREQGPVARIFAAPQDAYTQALLACRPTLAQTRAAPARDRRSHRRPRRRAAPAKAKDPAARVILEAARADQELLDREGRVRPQGVPRRQGRQLSPARRPHARRRRRIGLGQDDDGPDAAAPARGRAAGRSAARCCSTARTCSRSRSPSCCRCASASRSCSRTRTRRSTRASRSARRWSSR